MFLVAYDSKIPYSATVLPYFEGDYWVGVAEEMVKDIEDEKKDGDKVLMNVFCAVVADIGFAVKEGQRQKTDQEEGGRGRGRGRCWAWWR